MKIYLFNDTSQGHAGSRAVMQSICSTLISHEIIYKHKVHEKKIDFRAMADCDVVVVNGEGTMHHNAQPAKSLINVLRTAQTMGKKTFLINTVFQDMNKGYCGDVLRRLDYISVRETMSYEYVKKFGAGVHLRMDSSAGITLAGKVVKQIKGTVKGSVHPDSQAAGIINGLSVPYFGLECSFSDAVETLKQADCYVTGQFHGIMAAGLAGIPFVAIASNSWKIEGLIQWSNIPFLVCQTVPEVKQQMKWALHPKNKYYYQKFHEFIKRMPVFSSEDLNGGMGR